MSLINQIKGNSINYAIKVSNFEIARNKFFQCLKNRKQKETTAYIAESGRGLLINILQSVRKICGRG